jgi:hypothetical protein
MMHPYFLFTIILMLNTTDKMDSRQSSLYGKIALYECFSMPPEVSGVDWSGTTTSFMVSEEQERKWLIPVGNTTNHDTSWLAAPLRVDQTEWNYSLDLGLANDQMVEFILMSDKKDLMSSINGYSIVLDLDKENYLSFNRIDSNKRIPIYRKIFFRDNDDTFRLQVSRT